MDIRPFTIDIAQEVLDDLRERLTRTRWPADTTPGWDDGADLDTLRKLMAYWADGFDWRTQEARLNRFDHIVAEVDGSGLHAIHQRGIGPDPMPLLITHGWPDSFVRFRDLIPLLTDPGAHGGDPADAFTVVAPSIPGYGFSPARPGIGPAGVADLFARLMTGLGYDRYGAHGGDWGSTVTEALARQHGGALAGIHLTDIPWHHLFTVDPDVLTDAERDYLKEGQAWSQTEGAYAMIQSTKPGALAVGLSDSPAGLATWVLEKFEAWSDGGIAAHDRDALLANLTVYWATNTVGSSVRLYAEGGDESGGDESGGADRVEVPTGVAIFPRDIVSAPRAFGKRFFDVRRWTEMPRGGHFAALEEPGLLAEDLRAFFRPLR